MFFFLDPEFWAWVTAWTRDEIVWVWVRTASAALAGAVIGGVFTLRGQRAANRAQEGTQRREFEENRAAAAVEWDRDRAANAWEKSLDNARDLFEKFTALHREVRDAPQKKADMVGGTVWEQWDLIWDGDKALQLDIGSRLIADDPTRLTLQRIVWCLDRSDQLTAGYNPEAVSVPHPALALQLTNEAIEVVGSYIRRSPLSNSHKELIESLEKAWAAYEEFEEAQWSLQRSETIAAGAAMVEAFMAGVNSQKTVDDLIEDKPTT